jgi:hypothetical protein
MLPWTVWAEDALVKVFPDSRPASEELPVVRIEAARNETEAGQVVILPTDQHLAHVRLLPPLLRHQEGDFVIDTVQVRWVGFVRVRARTPNTPFEHLVRKPPGLFPDPLFDEPEVDIRKDFAQPVWLNVTVPAEAPPGRYRGTARIQAGKEQEVPVELQVYDATVPDRRTLKVTNWCSFENIARYHGLEAWSEEHWTLLAAYARNMAAHRQNVILTPLFSLIEFRAEGDRLACDFSRFDRFVQVFREAGVIGYIEGGHLGGRATGEWTCPHFAIQTRHLEGDRVVAGWATAGSPEAEAFLAQFLPALQGHLEERGWLDRYWQHLADEPIAENAASYNALVAAVRRHAPRLRIIEANHCHDLAPIEVWVPQLNYWHEDLDFYRDRQQRGEEVWFYTCLAPTGTYPNRFIDYPLLKVRLLHWLNFHYGATGYLHWGYNHWRGFDAFLDVEPVHGPDRCLPPGDHCIVYPGRRGPVDSIRFEALRDGVEDYELLQQLAARDESQARQISGTLIRDFNDCETSVSAFRAARRRLLEALVLLNASA